MAFGKAALPVVDAFIKYMSNYNRWEALGFPQGNGSLQEYLQELMQSNLRRMVQGLYTKADDHYPTNPVIWPPVN